MDYSKNNKQNGIDLSQTDVYGNKLIKDTYNNTYGFISDSERKITMYMASNDGHSIFYNLDDVESMYLGKEDTISLVCSDGLVHDHPRQPTIDEEVYQYQNEIDFSRKDIGMAVQIIKSQWPNWKDLLYLNDLNGFIYINEKMWDGKDNFVCYKGNGSDLTEIRVRLSQLTKFENNGRLIHYNPTKDVVMDAIDYIANLNHKNPFLELIKKTHWDGVNRIADFLYDVGFRAYPLGNKDAEV